MQTVVDEAAAEKVDLPDTWWRQNSHVAAWLLVVATAVLFLRYAAEVIVPFVLSGLLFYALDPAVDALQLVSCTALARRPADSGAVMSAAAQAPMRCAATW